MYILIWQIRWEPYLLTCWQFNNISRSAPRRAAPCSAPSSGIPKSGHREGACNDAGLPGSGPNNNNNNNHNNNNKNNNNNNNFILGTFRLLATTRVFRRGDTTPLRGKWVMLSPWEGATTQTQLSRPMSSGHHIAWSTDYGGNHIDFMQQHMYAHLYDYMCPVSRMLHTGIASQEIPTMLRSQMPRYRDREICTYISCLIHVTWVLCM